MCELPDISLERSAGEMVPLRVGGQLGSGCSWRILAPKYTPTCGKPVWLPAEEDRALSSGSRVISDLGSNAMGGKPNQVRGVHSTTYHLKGIVLCAGGKCLVPSAPTRGGGSLVVEHRVQTKKWVLQPGVQPLEKGSKKKDRRGNSSPKSKILLPALPTKDFWKI